MPRYILLKSTFEPFKWGEKVKEKKEESPGNKPDTSKL